MASVVNNPGGRKRILFVAKSGDRKAIWLGKMSKRTADEIKTKVESINTAAIAGHSIAGETAEWLGKFGEAQHAKFVKAGLATARQPTTPHRISGRSCSASCGAPAWNPGRSCSTISAPVGKPNWPRFTPCTSSARGSATRADRQQALPQGPRRLLHGSGKPNSAPNSAF